MPMLKSRRNQDVGSIIVEEEEIEGRIGEKLLDLGNSISDQNLDESN
jgi:hypothetical protein